MSTSSGENSIPMILLNLYWDAISNTRPFPQPKSTKISDDKCATISSVNVKIELDTIGETESILSFVLTTLNSQLNFQRKLLWSCCQSQ